MRRRSTPLPIALVTWAFLGLVVLAPSGASLTFAQAAGAAVDPPVARIDLAPFSAANAGIPSGWTPLEFPKIPAHTLYGLVEDEGVRVVRAESHAAASGLIHAVDVDLREHPILRWRWKVMNVLRKGDVTRRDGDDYPARIYVAFAFDPDTLGFGERLAYRAARLIYGDLPARALNYIWASSAAPGSVHPSPFTGSSRMLVRRSGSAELGRWIQEERNVYDDYRRAFRGEEPPRVIGVAIMTDTDNTGESAVALYGDVSFLAAPSP